MHSKNTSGQASTCILVHAFEVIQPCVCVCREAWWSECDSIVCCCIVRLSAGEEHCIMGKCLVLPSYPLTCVALCLPYICVCVCVSVSESVCVSVSESVCVCVCVCSVSES